MRPGQRIVDLGCWPGGWLQVASRAVGRRGRVVGVDLKPLDPPLINENVVAFTGDIEGPEVCERVLEELGGRAHLLLCDAAPNLTGIRDVDRAHEEALLEAVRRTIPSLLQPHGNLLVKILEAPEARVVELSIRRLFKSAKSLKPAATRKGSSERYLLARDLAEC